MNLVGNSCLKKDLTKLLLHEEGGICILQNVEKTVFDYQKEIAKLNDEIVAALYYLKVPYERWRFLTLWGEEKRKLELQNFSYDYEGYKRIKSLRDLLVEQREIVMDCWRLADERLANRAHRINNCIIGRETQALGLRLGMLDDEWKTDALKLQTVHTLILREERKLFGEESGDVELEKQIVELSKREGELGDKFFEHFQKQGAIKLSKIGCTVERALLGRSNNPEIYLNHLNVDVTKAYVCRFAADVYGYAEFLKYMSF